MIRNDLPRALVDNPRLDCWVGFDIAGVVRVATGKVELGQGVLTALAQMAAEELDVSPGRISLVSGHTGSSPEEGFTAGSQSIEQSGLSIRLVCAEVRELFVNTAAAQLGCEVDALSVEDGTLLLGGQASALDYWSLAPKINLSRPATGSAGLRATASFRHIGTSLPRIDLPAKLTGGAFIHDEAPDDVLHARVLHPPTFAAKLDGFDASIAQTRIGERAALLRVGDFLAVLSDDEALADAALEKLRVVVSWSAGPPLTPQHGEAAWLKNLPSIDRYAPSPHRDASQSATVRLIEASYSRPYLAHASIGPACALARWNGERLVVQTHSQGVGPLRMSLAQALALDAGAIEVRHLQGSGCYGHNGADDVALDACLIAVRHPERTVRVQWTRGDELSAGPMGAATLATIQAGLDDAGRPTFWNMEIWSPTHAQRPGMNGDVNLLAFASLPGASVSTETADVPDAGGGGGNRNSLALYDLPKQNILHHLVQNAPVRTSALRGLGTQANVLAIESFIDELAQAAGSDPVAYRLSLMSEPRARHVMEAAARMCAWQDRAAGGEGTGLGFAFSRYKNKAAYLAAAVEVDVDDAVRVRRIWCAVDAGLVINPDGALNQVEGGAIQAVSWTLKEQVRLDATGIVSRDWESYPILRFSEVPEVIVEFVGDPDEPSLGLGEVSLGPVTAAIANAVAHALGARMRHLPLTRERIAQTLLQTEIAS